MKVFSTSKWLALLTVVIPLLVVGVGWWIVGELNSGLIFGAALTATLCQIALTMQSDLQTIFEVEYEVFFAAAKKRQERLLEGQDRQDRVDSAARIHDSIINTLCAASMMTPGTHEQVLHARCRHDLVALQEFVAGSSSDESALIDDDFVTTAIAECVASHSAQLGLTTSFYGEMADFDSSPSYLQLAKAQLDSLQLAVRECLTNISKHSDSQEATVELAYDESGLIVTVTDQGSGWRTQAPVSASEFSLFALGRDVRVAVANDLGRGLRIEIRPNAERFKRAGAIRLAVRDFIELPLFRTINFWLTGLNIIVMAMFFDLFTWVWWLLAGMMVVSSSMAVINLYSLSRRIPQAILLAVVAGTGVLVASPALLDQPELGHWYVLVPATILLVIASWVGTRARAAWATLAALVMGAVVLAISQCRPTGQAGAATVVEPAVPESLSWVPWLMIAGSLVVGAGIVLGSRWIRGMITRSTDRIEGELGRAAAEEDVAALTAKRSDIRQRLVGRCMEVAEPMLSGIADGRIALDNEKVRMEVRYIERLLRSAISLGREQDQLSELLFDLLWSAYDQDVEVKIASYRSELLQTPAAAEQLRLELASLVDSLPAGSVVNVSTYQSDEGAQLLLVTQASDSEAQGVHEFNLAACR